VRRGWGAAALLVLALGACARGDRDERDAVRAVRAYDEAVVRAFRTNDAGGMGEVATEKEAKRVTVLVDLKAADRLVLESTLERLEVLSAARVGPDGFTIRTAERWRYLDRPLAPGRVATPEVLAEMRMEYEVARENGRWRVDKTRTLANDVLQPKPAVPRSGDGTTTPDRR
jgi:hypothetical protein